mmetsp:Transcript_84078/g.271034  ORF Transcript_84078/g.271034 Transcript_84078/m.271034 type:complete len:273 (+) Transcript_84078:135-953(+)
MNVLNAVFGVGASAAPLLVAAFRDVGAHGVFAYWAIACVDMVFIVAAVAIPATTNPRLAAKEDSRSEASDLPVSGNNASGYVELRDATQEVNWLAVSLCGACVLFACVIDSAVTFWLFTYSTQQLEMSAEAAGSMNTAFFLTFTATRFLCGWLVTVVGAACILKGSLAVALIASLGIVSPHLGHVLPCLGMIGVGIGVAPIAANATTVLGQKSFISGRAQGCVRVLAALGVMIGASGVGFLQNWDSVGDGAMPLVVFIGLVVETIVTIAFLW